MRRKDREISDRFEIDDILHRATICHLGLNDGGECYVVPVNYGYDGRCLYVHSAPEGRKIDIIRTDNRVGFTVYADLNMLQAPKACSFTMKYKSVMGRGLAFLVEEAAAKRAALNVIMKHYAQGEFDYEPERLGKIVIIKIEIKSLSGKKSV